MESETPSINPEEEVRPAENEKPASEPEQPQDLPVEVQTPENFASAEAQKPVKKSFFYRLLSPETRLGRFMRPLLRTTGWLLGMFALGILATYALLYNPLKAERSQLKSELEQVKQELVATRGDLNQKQAEVEVLKLDLSDLQAEKELGDFRTAFLIVKNDVLRARLALLDNSNGPGGPTALAALNDLEKSLTSLLPYVNKVDTVLGGLLSSRLEVVKGELVRDGQQAKVELESFYANLLELETDLLD